MSILYDRQEKSAPWTEESNLLQLIAGSYEHTLLTASDSQASLIRDSLHFRNGREDLLSACTSKQEHGALVIQTFLLCPLSADTSGTWRLLFRVERCLF